MDGLAPRQHHAPVRVLPHVKKLNDCFGDFLVRVSGPCGASRHIEPEALARIAGRSVTLAKNRNANALLELRQEGRRGGRGGEAEAATTRGLPGAPGIV